jgi:2-polyprenyl-6-methoxyphenol hydroxylase-like FAD-dependent oxidoreductase
MVPDNEEITNCYEGGQVKMNNSIDTTEELNARCCVVGGGPAGMMLGFLLARAGVEVVVLEKHADFFRDFRGDTIHPSTLELMYELGILDEFLERPHQKARQLSVQIGDTMLKAVDFTHVPTHSKFLAFMPQWDFLNFIAAKAKNYPRFNLRMEADATGLLREAGRVVGVRAATPAGTLEVRADLVVGADGRHSTIREEAGLEVMDFGAPMDVLWMALSRRPDDPGEVFFRADYGKFFIMIDRGDYFQCGLVIPKDGFEDLQRQGLDALRDDITGLVPFMGDRVAEIRNWDDVHALTVAVDRLRKWFKPGVLCIGDAAHAMSPVGGVGINLAIQDAVAAANILAQPLLTSTVKDEDLLRVQRRREPPVRLTQGLQIFIQNHLVRRLLESGKRMPAPWPLKLLGQWPFLRRIPARVVGVGFLPEHVRTPDSPKVIG